MCKNMPSLVLAMPWIQMTRSLVILPLSMHSTHAWGQKPRESQVLVQNIVIKYTQNYEIIRKKNTSLLSRLRGSTSSILQVIPDRYDLPVMRTHSGRHQLVCLVRIRMNGSYNICDFDKTS